MSTRPILSVVTVTFNDPIGLEATLRSLEPLKLQAGSDLEILVQDGGTVSVASSLMEKFESLASFESKPDNGIYDGMNLALARSSGESIWFLNGGDINIVPQWDALATELGRYPSFIILASYVLRNKNRQILRKARNASYIWHGLPTSHQAIFYPGDLIRAARYSSSYRIAGDYELTARLIVQNTSCRKTSLAVAVFQTGGKSQQMSKSIASEAQKVQRNILKTSRTRQLASRVRHATSRLIRYALTSV